jgi:D-beta-D-heptose 7-phosphate kinase/D-beta-D-heptose 1-phosphate adenosyltransferase
MPPAAMKTGKIIDFNEIRKEISELRKESKKIVFTNGCFDIIHAGHVGYLNEAKAMGDILVVGINSDKSVRRLKGESRPVINEKDRAYILANLKPVDYVVIFDEDTPYALIKEITPDILVKGGDYQGKNVVGRDIVEPAGGRVALIDFISGKSTSNIINTIKTLCK